jgi:hypothetical protein
MTQAQAAWIGEPSSHGGSLLCELLNPFQVWTAQEMAGQQIFFFPVRVGRSEIDARLSVGPPDHLGAIQLVGVERSNPESKGMWGLTRLRPRRKMRSPEAKPVASNRSRHSPLPASGSGDGSEERLRSARLTSPRKARAIRAPRGDVPRRLTSASSGASVRIWFPRTFADKFRWEETRERERCLGLRASSAPGRMVGRLKRRTFRLNKS